MEEQLESNREIELCKMLKQVFSFSEENDYNMVKPSLSTRF